MTSIPPVRRRWLVPGLSIGFVIMLLALLATSPAAWAPERRTATAEQVETARSIFRAARTSRTTGKPSTLQLDEADLDSVAALLSQGFAPYRADARIDRGALQLTLSRPVLFRWLNIRVRLSGRSEGFPAMQGQLGAFALPSWLVRAGIGAGHRLLALRGAQLPPLDRLVQSTAIDANGVRAEVMLPRTGLVDQAVGDKAVRIDQVVVARTYCRLTQLQGRVPDALFARQVTRALADAGEDPARNSAALVALAMLVVDPGVGELVGDLERRIAQCTIPPVPATLHGRTDLAQHWALSAALTAATGGRLASAMGEWKELADSLMSGPYLARTGFSFVDLAADRAGYLTALALTDPQRTAAVRSRLAGSSEDALLPRAALDLHEGLDNVAFVSRFGATDDPRYQAEVRRIDQLLANAGIE